MKFICFTILLLSFAQPSLADENDSKEVETAKTVEAPQARPITDFLFNADPLLDLSMAIKRVNGELFLFVEMDHNPNRNELTLLQQKARRTNQQITGVISENKAFGFNNKPVAYLPMLEMITPPENLENSQARPLEGKGTHRTLQIINLTQTLQQLAESGQLRSETQTFKAREILEISLIHNKIEAGSPLDVGQIRVSLEKAASPQLEQIYGKTQVTDMDVAMEAARAPLAPIMRGDVLIRYLTPLAFLSEEINPGERLSQIEKTIRTLPFDLSEERIDLISRNLSLMDLQTMVQFMEREQASNFSYPLSAPVCKNLFSAQGLRF